MNTYTDQQVSEALALLELNSGNVKRTATELGIPRATLTFWRDKALAVDPERALSPVVTEERDFAAVWAEAQGEVLALLREKAPTASFRDLSIFAGIAADKHLDYSVGRKGSQVTVDNRTQNVIASDSLIASILERRGNANQAH